MRRGPLYMIVAGLLLTIMVALVKHARTELSALDVVFWRGLTALPLAWLIARRVGWRLYNPPLFALRVCLGFAAMVLFFTAARGLAVADLSLISKLQPILIAILAPVFLGAGERGGARIWALLAFGLTGCTIILAPDLAVGSRYGLYCVAATVFSAGSHVCIRGLMRTDDSRVIVLYFQTAAMLLAAGGLAITTGGLPDVPDASLLPYLLGIGVCATGGQLLMTQAYAEDRAPVVAAASYSAPVWGVIADLVAFSHPPTWHVVVGGAIIVGAGLALLFSNDESAPPADVVVDPEGEVG